MNPILVPLVLAEKVLSLVILHMAPFKNEYLYFCQKKICSQKDAFLKV